MGNYKYISNRILKNSSGKENGNLAVRVPKNSEMAEVKYKCPECKHQQMKKQEWKRPFNVKCDKCGFMMKMPRLKDEMKKEKALART